MKTFNETYGPLITEPQTVEVVYAAPQPVREIVLRMTPDVARVLSKFIVSGSWPLDAFGGNALNAINKNLAPAVALIP